MASEDTAIDLAKWIVATADFGTRMDALFMELVRTNAISPEAGQKLAGMGASWSSISNASLQDIVKKIAIVEMKAEDKKGK